MRIAYSSLPIFKNKAQHLAKLLHIDSHKAALNVLARLSGYADYHEVSRSNLADGRSVLPLILAAKLCQLRPELSLADANEAIALLRLVSKEPMVGTVAAASGADVLCPEMPPRLWCLNTPLSAAAHVLLDYLVAFARIGEACHVDVSELWLAARPDTLDLLSKPLNELAQCSLTLKLAAGPDRAYSSHAVVLQNFAIDADQGVRVQLTPLALRCWPTLDGELQHASLDDVARHLAPMLMLQSVSWQLDRDPPANAFELAKAVAELNTGIAAPEECLRYLNKPTPFHAMRIEHPLTTRVRRDVPSQGPLLVEGRDEPPTYADVLWEYHQAFAKWDWGGESLSLEGFRLTGFGDDGVPQYEAYLASIET